MKKDSAPPSPSRSPASGSPTAHSAGQASRSSPNTRSRASPSRQELFSPDSYSTASRAACSRQGPRDDDSPRNPERPVKFRSLVDIYASTDPIEESSGAKVPPRLDTHSPRTEKVCCADSYGGSLKLRIKVPRRLGIQSPREAKRSGADFHSPGAFTSVSSLGNQEIKDNVLADHLKQEVVNVENQTSLGTSSGGPVGSTSGPGEPSRAATETSAEKKPRKRVRFRDPIIENEW